MRRSRGYSLVEILIVMSILAVMSAMTFPVFREAQRGGGRTVCLSQLRQLQMAANLYRGDAPSSGQPWEMGLPMPFSNLIDLHYTERQTLKCTGESLTPQGHFGYTMMYPQSLDSATRSEWVDYSRRLEESIVLITDSNHDYQLTASSSPLKTHRSLAVYLDGHAKAVVRVGNPMRLSFYHP